MKRSLALAIALAATAFAIPAFAREGREKLNFPVKGDVFLQHVEARLTARGQRMEKFLAEKSVPQDKATAIRGKFQESAARVRQEAQKAAADGTVTQEEAKAVRMAGGHGFGGHGHGHDGGNCKHGEKKS